MQLCKLRALAYIGVWWPPHVFFSYRIRALCVLDAHNVCLNITKRISDTNWGVRVFVCTLAGLCEQSDGVTVIHQGK